jgi:hypothetical protein
MKLSTDAIETVQTGRFTLSGRDLRTLQGVLIPDVATVADFSGNLLTDFEGFLPPADLHTLIVNDNPILSFKGFPDVMLRHFSANSTPISDLPNFRELTLIALGDQLETINDTPVTAADRRDASADRFKEYFERRDRLKKSPKRRQAVDPRECLRNGYVCNHWPRELETIEAATEDQKDDPITVRILRHMRLVGGTEAVADALVERIFCPRRPRTKATGQQPDERIDRQQALIEIMKRQLAELAAGRRRRIAGFRRTPGQVSDGTRDLYMSMVQGVGQELMSNAKGVEKELPNYAALRSAVIRLFRAEEDTPDSQLIQMLREARELH